MGATSRIIPGKIANINPEKVVVFLGEKNKYIEAERKIFPKGLMLNQQVKVNVIFLIEDRQTRIHSINKFIGFDNLLDERLSENTRLIKTFSVVRDPSQQSKLRSDLLDFYSQCVISACKIEPILEAAHIYPVANGGECSMGNSLLLRSDLHKMFDRGLITIDAESYLIKLSDSIKDFEQYADLLGKIAFLPSHEGLKTKLEWHNKNVFIVLQNNQNQEY
jgi:predicted restriction endonuclease